MLLDGQLNQQALIACCAHLAAVVTEVVSGKVNTAINANLIKQSSPYCVHR